LTWVLGGGQLTQWRVAYRKDQLRVNVALSTHKLRGAHSEQALVLLIKYSYRNVREIGILLQCKIPLGKRTG